MTANVHALPSAVESPAAPDNPSARLARGGGWLMLVLALTALLAMTEALVSAEWSDGLELVRFAVLGGALLAFALSLTRWDGIFPVIYSTLASFAWITTLFNQIVFAGFTRDEGIRELVTRNANWLLALVNGKASADNLIFVTQLTFLGWWIGYLAIWSLMRHQRLLLAVLPAGIGLLVNIYFSSQNLTGFLVLFLAAALLLAIRLQLARNEIRWQLTRVRYASDISLDFLKAGAGFAVLVIGLAWLLPSATGQLTAERLLRPFEEPWQKVEDTWNRMYKSLNYGSTAATVSAFGKTSTLGGPVSLSDRPIFEAEIAEPTYWRAAIFDAYTGSGWLNSDTEVMVIERSTSLGEPLYSQTHTITGTVRILQQGGTTVFTPPQPLRVTVPVNADFHPIPSVLEVRTVSLLRSRVSLSAQEPYLAAAAFSDATLDALRADTANYPEWVLQRYLQLPDTLPARIRDLATNTTAAKNNAYDKAEALESMLRTYTYNQQIAAPPAGADGVDYFLFEVREGYCDYYASAMVVMLRAVGVPARLVMGYTAGQVVDGDKEIDFDTPVTRRILERNAHAWPEVFFPTYGWIQFEPTASEPLLARPRPAAEAPDEAGLIPDSERHGDTGDDLLPDDLARSDDGASNQAWLRWRIWLSRNWGWFAGILILAAAAWGGWRLARARQAALFRDHEVLMKLFGLLGMWAARLRIPWLASQTPLERATSFSSQLPEAAPVAEDIAHLFVAQRYGRERPAAETLTSLAEKWQILQPALWRGWLRGRLAALSLHLPPGPRRDSPA